MNNTRRSELYDVVSLLDEAIDRLNEIKTDEQDSFDAMPEGFQYSARGDKMQEAMDKIDEFIDGIEKIRDKIELMAIGK